MRLLTLWPGFGDYAATTPGAIRKRVEAFIREPEFIFCPHPGELIMSRFFCLALIAAIIMFTGCTNDDSAGSGNAPAVTTTATPANAPLPDPSALIRKLATQDGCRDFSAEMRLTGASEEGKPVRIDFSVQRKYSDKETATLLIVTAPREETEKALLAIERADQPTEAISYLAGLKKIARFRSNSTRDFHGAKIYIQELLGMELNQYSVEKAERVTEGGEQLIRISLKQKGDAELAFPRIDVFIRENSQQPKRCELFDAQHKPARVVSIEEVKEIQNYQTITRVSIEDRISRRTVRMETLKVKYDQKLPDSIFTEANLTKLISQASRRLIQ